MPDDHTDYDALGPLRERFVVDSGDLRVFAFVRTAIALTAAVAAAVLLLSRVPVVIAAVALVGLLVPLAWLRQAKTARRQAAEPELYALELYARGLVVRDVVANQPRVTVLHWREVAHIEIDDERLEILVKRADGTDLRIEARYPGVALDELVRRLCAARNAA